MVTSTLIGVILLLVAITYNGLSLSINSSPPNLALKDVSFSLITTLTVSTIGVEHQFKYHLIESYSKPENRTKIRFKIVGDKQDWEQYVNGKDSSKQFKLSNEGAIYSAIEYGAEFFISKLDEESGACYSFESNSLIERFYSTKRLKTDTRLPDYVLGPARILFYLDQFRKKMVQSNDKNILVRNVPAIMFNLVVDEAESIIYRLYYHANYVDNSLPIRLIVQDSQRESIFDFNKREKSLIGPQLDGLYWTIGDDSPKHNEVLMDPASGCTQLIDRRFLSTNQPSFSFVATVFASGYRKPTEISVAYSNNLQSLRVDQVKDSLSLMQLSNFYSGLKFLISIGDSDSSATRDAQCIVTEETRDLGRFKIGELLFGAPYMVYLGKAQVRGIQARVYQCLVGQLPIWFRSMHLYHSKNSVLYGSVGKEKSRLRAASGTLIYTTDEDLNWELMNPGARLLQIEQQYFSLGEWYSKTVIQVHDFSWTIGTDFMGHQRVEDLFSVADLCPDTRLVDSTSRPTRQGIVDLVLVAREWTFEALEANSWFRNGLRRRNFALLSLIQSDLKQPLIQVSHLESKILITHKGQPTQLAVSFRLAELRQNFVQLTHLGRGELHPGNTQGFEVHHELEFQDCLFKIANQYSKTSIMAHATSSATCLIGPPGLDALEDSFDIDENDNAGTYTIFRLDQKLLDRKSSFEELPESSLPSDCKFKELELSMQDFHSNKVQLFRLQSISLLEDAKTSIQQRAGSSDSVDTNKFIGLGLMPTDSIVKRLKPPPVSSGYWLSNNFPLNDKDLSYVSFDQCQVVCFHDFECESFSVCLQDGKIDCLLSKVGFRDTNAVTKLLEFKAKGHPQEQMVESILFEEFGHIPIQKNPNCELHNKIYLNSFANKVVHEASLKHYTSIQFVDSRENCAKLCLKQTIETLDEDLKASNTITFDLLSRPDADPDRVRHALSDHEAIMMKLCENFHYYELGKAQQDQKLLEFFKSFAKIDLDHATGGGFCMLNGNSPFAKQQQNQFELYKIIIENFELKPEIFFERRSGVKLIGSKLNTDSALLNEALELVKKTSHKVLNALQYDSLKSWVERGENYQVINTEAKSETRCALACLGQKVRKPWPMCKSFSIVRKQGQDSEIEFLCLLNSITLHEAIRMERFDLVEEHHNHHENEISETLMWQYDPRTNFVLSKLVKVESDLAMASSAIVLQEPLDETFLNSNRSMILVHLQSIAELLLIVLGSLICGSLIGFKLADSLALITSRQNVGPDQDNLVDGTELNNFFANPREQPERGPNQA